MTSITFFFVFIPILAIILLAINLIFAPHNPYQEKDSAFECGFHSFLGQNRTQFSISFFIFALLFLLFDLEILLVYPYVVSAYTNNIYGLAIMLIFFLALTLGFAFELGKNALKIDSRQMFTLVKKQSSLISQISSVDDNSLFVLVALLKEAKVIFERQAREVYLPFIYTLFYKILHNNMLLKIRVYFFIIKKHVSEFYSYFSIVIVNCLYIISYKKKFILLIIYTLARYICVSDSYPEVSSEQVYSLLLALGLVIAIHGYILYGSRDIIILNSTKLYKNLVKSKVFFITLIACNVLISVVMFWLVIILLYLVYPPFGVFVSNVYLMFNILIANKLWVFISSFLENYDGMMYMNQGGPYSGGQGNGYSRGPQFSGPGGNGPSNNPIVHGSSSSAREEDKSMYCISRPLETTASYVWWQSQYHHYWLQNTLYSKNFFWANHGNIPVDTPKNFRSKDYLVYIWDDELDARDNSIILKLCANLQHSTTANRGTSESAYMSLYSGLMKKTNLHYSPWGPNALNTDDVIYISSKIRSDEQYELHQLENTRHIKPELKDLYFVFKRTDGAKGYTGSNVVKNDWSIVLKTYKDLKASHRS